MDAQAAVAELIALVDPGADAPRAASALLARYGAISQIASAPAEDIARAGGVNMQAAQLLRIVPSLARYQALDAHGERPLLSTFRRAAEYLPALYVGRGYEHFYLLYLGADGRLIRPALITRGTLDETAFYLRNMLDEALASKARAVVLAHNHPGGTDEPSEGDVTATRIAIRALSKVGIVVLDHAIIANGRANSMRAAGLIEEGEFLRQDPGEKLLLGWLD